MVLKAIVSARIVFIEAWGRLMCTYSIEGLGTERSRVFSILPRPILNHLLILFNGSGIRSGKTPFSFNNVATSESF